MALEKSLIDLERFCAKAWRVYAKEDPLSHLSFNEFDYLRVIQLHPEGIRITDLAEELQLPSLRLQTWWFVWRERAW